jgi:histidine triad (HIT) family protein
MATYDATTKNNECIFCKIVEGTFQTPGIFWQDEEFMAFLSIDPNTEGFSCVIPKEHYGSDVLKMPDDVLQKFILASKKVAAILENYFEDVGRVGLIMEGTGVNHAHIKLVPMHGTEELKVGKWKQFQSGKELWFDTYEGWIASAGGPMADMEKLKELAEKIKLSQNK